MTDSGKPTISSHIPSLPRREAEGHKGTYGRVLMIAGSRGMSGAACLAGKAALRGGAGLVAVACPQEIVSIVAGFEPSYLTLPLPDDGEGRLGEGAFEKLGDIRYDAVAIGPGLGKSEALGRLVAQVIRQTACPLVIDADGLNLLAGQLDVLKERPAATILTPHPGEFSRLTGMTADEIQHNRPDVAARFAREHGVVLVLKGHHSIVTDGAQLGVNSTGNPGMATGGTGDVLTGLLAALLGQKMPPFDAARLGAYVHGLAGDIVAARGCETSLIASDLLAALPEALRQMGG